MHCRKVRGELVNFIEGSLDDELAQAIGEHLITCEACFDESEAIREILTKAGQGFGPDPIVLADGFLESAAIARASALHFQPGPSACRIRRRVEGVLEGVEELQPVLGRQVINRVKLLAGMRLAANHLAQSAYVRWESEETGREYDLQFSTMPTPSGDSLVVRIRRPGGVLLSLDDLGVRQEDLQRCEQLLAHESGLVLVAAPARSGRMATLYALIHRLQDETRHIVTLESPVDARLPGVTQVPVIDEAHLSFEDAVKYGLAHDPDVLVCGDMPDIQTVRACLDAGISGKLVLAGFMAERSSDALRRLVELGAEGFLITATLRGIIAQRPVRRLCDECKQSSPATQAEADWLAEQTGRSGEQFTVWRAKGCDACHGRGYRGRTALFEILALDEALSSLILSTASADDIAQHAQATIHPLAADAAQKALEGLTTVEEAARAG